MIERYPQGQLLLAGTASLAPALELRRLAEERRLFVETYLAAAYPLREEPDPPRLIVIVPTADAELPPPDAALGGRVDSLLRRLPPHALALAPDELPRGSRPGTAATFAETMALWEQLHLPHLNAAAREPDAPRRIAAYRRVIGIDYACEKAHQWLATTALDHARASRSARDAGSASATVAERTQ